MDEPQTGAIRMMAFGVLEHDPTRTVAEDFRAGRKAAQTGNWDELQARAARDQKALEIEAMVVAEFNALGWKLAHKARPNMFQFILLGAMGGTTAMPVRPKIGEGSLQDVCRAAVDWLDNGPQPEGRRTTTYHEREVKW